MQTKIEKVFSIDAPAPVAWRLLQDIKGVAECMPGAEVTERVDDSHYKGLVRVKLGPATAMFKGDIEVKSLDPGKRQLALTGKGSDVKGASGASMDLTAYIREIDAAKSELVGNAEVTVSGKFASFGGRMMTQFSDQILKQFGANFANRAQAMGAGAPPGAAQPAEKSSELNAFALIGHVVADFFRRLFGRGDKSKTPN